MFRSHAQGYKSRQHCCTVYVHTNVCESREYGTNKHSCMIPWVRGAANRRRLVTSLHVKLRARVPFCLLCSVRVVVAYTEGRPMPVYGQTKIRSSMSRCCGTHRKHQRMTLVRVVRPIHSDGCMLHYVRLFKRGHPWNIPWVSAQPFGKQRYASVFI